MIALFCLFLTLCASPLKSKSRLEAENAALRYQLIILQRMVRGRVRLTNGDHLFLILLYRWFTSVLKAITIIRPETLVRWHRAGFRRYWRWKSCSLGGRPQIDADLRALIQRITVYMLRCLCRRELFRNGTRRGRQLCPASITANTRSLPDASVVCSKVSSDTSSMTIGLMYTNRSVGSYPMTAAIGDLYAASPTLAMCRG
jgi:hypothetical protein